MDFRKEYLLDLKVKFAIGEDIICFKEQMLRLHEFFAKCLSTKVAP